MFRESRLLSQSIDAPKPLGNAEGDTPVHDNFDVEEYGRKRREKREQLHALEAHDATTKGFAEIKETPEVLEQFSTAEKLEILQSMLEEAQELPEEILRRVEQVEILRLVVENSINEICAPKTTLQKWANTGTNVRKMLRLPTPAEDMLERYAADMQQMLDTDIPKVIQEVVQGEKTLQEILHDFPRLQKVSEEAYRWDDAEHYKDDPGFGMNLTETASQEDMLSQYNLLMRYYRWRQNYEGAEDLAYRFIGEDLKSTMNENDRGALRVQAEEKVNRLVEKNKEAWMNNGDHPMTEEDVSNYREGLIEQEYRHHIMHQGAVRAKKTHTIPGSGNGSESSIAKMHMYNQYVDMRDPHGHWFNVKDENWDTIVEELVINAPMIIASGGVSGILSAGARTVALRMAPSLIVKHGAKLTAKNIAKRTAVGVPALLTEGAAFELIHSGLQGDALFAMPDWGQRILWSSFTLGMIHSGAKVGERAFTKGVGDAAKATLLGKYVNNISNPSVRECAKQCLVKGHTEAASMLIAGAFQNGACTGDIDAFYEGFGGDEWLHAYITVGALKVSRAGLETASGKVFRANEGKQKKVKQSKEDALKNLADKTLETLHDIHEIILHHHPELNGYPLRIEKVNENNKDIIGCDTGRRIVFVDHPDTVFQKGINQMEKKGELDEFANRLCITSKEVTPAVMRLFYFTHEWGHAMQRIRLRQACKMNGTDYAAAERQESRNGMDKHPFPGYDVAELRAMGEQRVVQMINKNTSLRKRLENLGIMNYRQLIIAQTKAHRLLPVEIDADNFAAAFIKEHNLLDRLPKTSSETKKDIGTQERGDFAKVPMESPAQLKNYLKTQAIDDATRSKLTATILGKESLSAEQKAALIDAHNKPGEIDNLTEGQKTVKGLALMRNEAFTREEAQQLMDAGLAGTPPPPPPPPPGKKKDIAEAPPPPSPPPMKPPRIISPPPPPSPPPAKQRVSPEAPPPPPPHAMKPKDSTDTTKSSEPSKKESSPKLRDAVHPSQAPLFKDIPPFQRILITHCTYATSAIERGRGSAGEDILGYNARASTYPQGKLREKYDNITLHASYYLPYGWPRNDVAGAPVRLIFEPTKQVFGQIRYREKATDGREGSYFGDILLNENPKHRLDILDCLRCWKAPAWQNEDGKTIRHDLPPLKPADMLQGKEPAVSDTTLKSFLSQEGNPNNPSSVDPKLIPPRWQKMPPAERRELFTHILASYLESRTQGKKCMIVAEPGVATLFFYGIARLLPPNIRNSISFSTFESPDRVALPSDLMATTYFNPNESLPDAFHDSAQNKFIHFNTCKPNERSPVSANSLKQAQEMIDTALRQGFDALDDMGTQKTSPEPLLPPTPPILRQSPPPPSSRQKNLPTESPLSPKELRAIEQRREVDEKLSKMGGKSLAGMEALFGETFSKSQVQALSVAIAETGFFFKNRRMKSILETRFNSNAADIILRYLKQ